MKTIRSLLLVLAVGFTCSGQIARPAKVTLRAKTICNDYLLTMATRELAVPNLRRVYGKALLVKKITRNAYYPTVRDTLLEVTTAADKLQLFSNTYNAFLLKAEITSQKVTFGKGIRIGISQAAFCKAFRLPAAFDGYQLADAEGRSSLYFLFRQGVLVSVSYAIGWLD